MMKNNAAQQLALGMFYDTIETHPNLKRHAENSPFDLDAYFPKPRYNDTTANGLTRCIIDYIKLHGGQAERITVMGRPTEVCGRVKWGKSHMTVGTADISATIQGRSVKIEVKIGTDKQSKKQKKYQSDIERAGGLYYVARSFNEFVKWYEETKF